MNYAQELRNGSIDLLIYFILSITRNLPLCSLLTFSFILFNAMTLISMKYFISITMIVSNLIDLFLFGLVSVIINWMNYFLSFGLLIFGFLVYRFITRIEFFLSLLFLLESFSSIFQSFTLSNRLSINLLSGTLLVSLLVSAIRIMFNSVVAIVVVGLLIIIFAFELLNSLIQLFIFLLLTIEYSV